METIRPIIGCNSTIRAVPKPFIGIFSTHSGAPDTYLSGRSTAEKTMTLIHLVMGDGYSTVVSF